MCLTYWVLGLSGVKLIYNVEFSWLWRERSSWRWWRRQQISHTGTPGPREALELPSTVLEMTQARSHIILTLLCCCPVEIQAHGRGQSYSESCSGGPGLDHRGVTFGAVFSPLDATSLGPPLSSGPHCSSPRELHPPLDHSPLHPSNDLPNLVMHLL